MKYYMINTLGNDQDKTLAFITRPPEGLGIHNYRMARGIAIGDIYPQAAKIYLERRKPGTKLVSLIGNTQRYLIVCTDMKELIEQHVNDELELLAFTLYDHKERVLSDDYWIINPIGTNDVLNKDASDIRYSVDNPADVVSVRKFILDPELLTAEPNLFRVPQVASRYFISERLARAFFERDFSNMHLLEIEQQEAS